MRRGGFRRCRRDGVDVVEPAAQIRAMRELGMRFISAAPIAADMYRDIEERYGCRVVTMYGHDGSVPDRLQGGVR